MPKIMFQIGDRIGVNDYFGTVKYKGPVDNAKGEYYGVEWDLVERGKHNGTHQGKTYFTIRDGANSGSFVRGKLITPAVSCTEGINDRYGKIEDDSVGIDESASFLRPGRRGQVINIEVVGMKRINDLQCQFDTLRIINLSGMCVYGEPDSEALGRFVPELQELDLSNNTLSSWSTVANIIRHLDNLQFLHLSGNRLTLCPEEIYEIHQAFQKLKKLNVSFMDMTWKEVLECSELWLNIRELHLCSNNITEVTAAPNWQHLRLLNLEGNSLKTWSNVKPFSKLPNLKELLLSGCELSDITVEEEDFLSLTMLDIGRNKICEWRSIGDMGIIPHLSTLICSRNPLLDVLDIETNRQLLIAKIPSLKKLNKTSLDSQERKGAEIDYSKRFGEEWIDCGASLEPTEANASFCREHPTYLSIIKKWGAPEKSEVKKSKPVSALRESLIEVTFVDLVTESGKTVTKYIPETMSVVKVRNLATKLLGIKGIPSAITYRARKNDEEYKFEYDLRQVTFYGVEHGDEILVRRIP